MEKPNTQFIALVHVFYTCLYFDHIFLFICMEFAKYLPKIVMSSLELIGCAIPLDQNIFWRPFFYSHFFDIGEKPDQNKMIIRLFTGISIIWFYPKYGKLHEDLCVITFRSHSHTEAQPTRSASWWLPSHCPILTKKDPRFCQILCLYIQCIKYWLFRLLFLCH